MIGQVIGNYRVVAELGKGGMGLVYRAEHTQLGRPAALKMLLPQFSSDPAIVQRFFNEARAASAIDHPGIVEVYDFGTAPNGAAYIVMALLKGESLEQRLRRGPLPPLEGASIVAQVLGALAAAHARGIVHRDLKPDNIFLTPNDLMPDGVQVKLLDFGIAKLADDVSSGGYKTQTGVMMGTPAYMSPEQCMGRADLDHRTDLYAIGCILFHVLTGRPPFMGEGGTGMMIAAHMRDPAPHPRSINPAIPDPLAAIVMRLLEKDPAARFQSALETRQALVAAGASAPSKVPTSADQYGATMAALAPTTASGAAAQSLPATQPVPARTRGNGIAIGLGVLAAGSIGAAAFFALRSSHDAAAPAAAPPVVAPITAQPAGRPVEPTAPPPAPPPSSVPHATQDRPPAPSPPTPTPPPSSTPAPAFSLAKKAFAPGDTIAISFASRVSSPSSSRAWITVVEAGASDPTYGTWKYIDDGATSAALVAPSDAGAYEVRLHTDYPSRSFNVRQRVPITVGTVAKVTPRNEQRFLLTKQVVSVGDSVELTFPTALQAAAGEKFWVTVVAKGAADTAYGAYAYVPDGARTMDIDMPSTPGDYEIRLHANYPRLPTNLVHRAPIRVEQ